MCSVVNPRHQFESLYDMGTIGYSCGCGEHRKRVLLLHGHWHVVSQHGNVRNHD